MERAARQRPRRQLRRDTVMGQLAETLMVLSSGIPKL